MANDLISRQAAIDAFRKELCREREYATPFISLNGCERILNELPSAERRGRWIFDIDDEGWSWDVPFKCTQCGEWNGRETPYCPNCGSFNGEGGENEKLQR